MPRLRTALALLPLLLAGPAQAAVLFTADLTHSQETTRGILQTSTGAPRPLSFGTATLTLNDAQTELAVSATIFNIDVTGLQTADTFDDLAAAHIHVGAPPGSNAPVRWGFFGTPDNDNDPDNLVVTPFATGVGGTFFSIWNLVEGNAGTTLASNLPGIFAGLAYVNFHTNQFLTGEIRGQIVPAAVPEPSGALLLGSALAALAACCGRRRRPSAAAPS